MQVGGESNLVRPDLYSCEVLEIYRDRDKSVVACAVAMWSTRGGCQVTNDVSNVQQRELTTRQASPRSYLRNNFIRQNSF